MDRIKGASQSIFSYKITNDEVLSEVKSEIIRKSIHFLIALSPLMASYNKPFAVFFLLFGTLGYILMEYLRISGVYIPVVSSVTDMASRPRDAGRFIMGPVTLGFGALLALLLFPSYIAAIAIYAVAFGDGIASLIGRFLGKFRPAFLFGKSIEGSTACFFMVFISAYLVCSDFRISFIAAFAATAVEALPLKDYDNLVIPVFVGFVVRYVI
jgi:dolichol kinase